MRILIAPQELKGTLTAVEAARALARAALNVFPQAEIDIAALADGGPGTVDALLSATGGQLRHSPARDPLGRWRSASWGLLPDGTAVIEMAAASGLSLLLPEERDPRVTSSAGTGDLIVGALRHGCREIVVGLGGSATNDGGAGAAQALGINFLDARGEPLPPGGAALAQLETIDVKQRIPDLAQAQLTLATDVSNPLLGPEGATRVFGPQKGAGPAAVEELEAAMTCFAKRVEDQLHQPDAQLAGRGAAGGLAFGLSVLAGGIIRSGFGMVERALQLERRIQTADLVLTAEGRFDFQTLDGKGPGELARLARKHAKTIVMITGATDSQAVASGLFHSVELILAAPNESTASNLEATAASWLRRWHQNKN